MGYLNNLYKIFKGTVAGDKTGTPARTAAQGINDNMDAIDNAMAAIDTASEKKVNKVPNLDAVNDTTYPTSKAVKDYSDGKEIAANNFTSSQLGSYQAKSEKGIANGYAGLDANALVPAVNLPAFVDEILEGQYIDATTFNDDAPTPAPYTPASGKLYVDKVAVPPKIYRWGGSVYAEIVGSPGSTDVVAEGTTNLYFSGARVLATVLAGLDTLTALAVNSGDTILVGIGKLQAQFNTISTSIGNKLDKGTYTGNAGDLKSLIDAKETPLGAKAKADTAETNAKAYADTLLKETIAGRYATYAAMIADQVNQVSKGVYAVADASGFSTVDAGYADFEYLGTTLGTEADYRKLSEEESMDIVAGGVQSVTGSAVDNTDPNNPVINSTGGGADPTVVSSFKASANYRFWQGVGVDANYIYACSDRSTAFALNNSIQRYDHDGIFVDEITSVYTQTDPQGKFMSFGSMIYVDATYLYIPTYNQNSGGSPLISRISRFNKTTLAWVDDFEIGGNVAEGLTFYAGEWYVCYFDIMKVRKFNTSWVLQTEYNLSQAKLPDGGYQSIFFIGSDAYFNWHGSNDFSGDYAPGVDKYSFDGAAFTFVENTKSPTFGSGQGVVNYNDKFYWIDRIDNKIIITNSLTAFYIHWEEILTPENTFQDLFMLDSGGTKMFQANVGALDEYQVSKMTGSASIVYRLMARAGGDTQLLHSVGGVNKFLTGYDFAPIEGYRIYNYGQTKPVFFNPIANDYIGLNGVTDPKSKLEIGGGIKIANDLDAASAAKEGTLRYRFDGSNSFFEICKQTSPSIYSWVDASTGGVNTAVAFTGTVIPLNNSFGAVKAIPSYNATYTIGTKIIGCSAVIVIDTTGQTVFPTITGATLTNGSAFVADKTFRMYVDTLDGANVEYFFALIN